MDDDDYGDIPDEDMMLAVSQAEARPAASSTAPKPSINGLGRNGVQTSSQSGFRQTTLFGEALDQPAHRPPAPRPPANIPSHRPSSHRPHPPYVADVADAPTHHALDPAALDEWIYPTNLGPVRDYQFSIVKNGLFHNTLVALPTGLGKTFIAATVMLNFFRWTRDAKIVFVAPTKPLVAQQVDACLNVAGIPRSTTTRLDGEVPPAVREGEWARKRLFFMTPQTLINDLSKGYADPKSIVLLVVDEAHRATGEYAYVKVVEFLRRFSRSFRVLALTATPGSTVEAVQDVISHLGISHVEIRTEESLDIRDYVHARNVDAVVLEPSDEMLHVRDLFAKTLKPLVDKLSAQNIYWGRDPMALTTYGLLRARTDWMAGPGRHVNQGTKYMMLAIFSLLQSLAHAIKLLNFHGIRPFYNNLADFRSSTEDKGASGSKYKRQILNDPSFQRMMDTIAKWQRLDGFMGHPKMTYLCDTLLNHFMDAGENSATRAIVFSEYRDSAEEIVRVLNGHRPLTRAAVFVGQADSKRSEGMKQKQQMETINKFKAGAFNVLVATSIGEEGLDIGQVDLIVCYDASASPIRMLQRMGRTGRKRAGNIVLLLMKGKEEDQFARARDNYSHIQRLICDGSHFDLCHHLSSRILPRDARPQVQQRIVEIPFENTQARDLLDPKKTAAALRKKPSKKKFHMPDGVETGFMSASAAFGYKTEKKTDKKNVIPPAPPESDFLVDNPPLEDVLLTERQAFELNKSYRTISHREPESVSVAALNLAAFPAAQRSLRPTVKLKHGERTRRCVKLLAKLARNSFDRPARGDWRDMSVAPFEDSPRSKRPRPQEVSVPSKRRASESATIRRRKSSPDDRPHGRRVTTGRKGRLRPTAGGHVEDLGDDCERTSDLAETDGSDSGADLVDFVVGDDEITSSMMRSMASTSPTSRSSPPSRNGHAVINSQDSDDMPDLDALVGGKKRKQRAVLVDLLEDDDDIDDVSRKVAANKRRVVDDSEDDDE